METSEIISTYLVPALIAALTALAGYLGSKLKTLCEQRLNDKTKRAVVRTAVTAAEQLYHDLGGPEKLKQASDGATEMLAEKGITISSLELRMLIESVVAEFNYSFNGALEEPND